MTTTLKIIFIGMLLFGVSLWITYTYIALWQIPRLQGERNKLGWYAMLIASAGTFSLFLSWWITEPLAKNFLPIFFIFSLIIGYFARVSAISPFELAEFWSKFGRSNDNENLAANQTSQIHMKVLAFLYGYKFIVSLASSATLLIILKLFRVQLPYILTFALLFILINISINILHAIYGKFEK
ncbi:MAG: hypothetical protein HS100_18890 [Anaerolineales bacterium]|nr:hypothetical protein [Anaerolineales bacterium]